MKMHKLPWKCCKCANNFICRLYVVVLSVLVQAYRQTDRLADKRRQRQRQLLQSGLKMTHSLCVFDALESIFIPSKSVLCMELTL